MLSNVAGSRKIDSAFSRNTSVTGYICQSSLLPDYAIAADPVTDHLYQSYYSQITG